MTSNSTTACGLGRQESQERIILLRESVFPWIEGSENRYIEKVQRAADVQSAKGKEKER